LKAFFIKNNWLSSCFVAAAVNEKHLSGRFLKIVTPNLGSLGSFIAIFYMGGGAQQ
jgi:hypothetical protein